jgi:tRNA A-37 threonylcarbamoyl transferase component Bud32
MTKLKFNKRLKNMKSITKPFFSSGSYGCVYYPEFTCLGKKTTKKYKENVSKLSLNNFYTKNEIELGIILKKYVKDRHLLGIHRSCNVSKGKVQNMQNQHSCKIIEESSSLDNFVLLYSRFIDNVEAHDFMKKYNTINTIIVLLDTLLSKISKLQKHGIIHNDLHFGNVLIERKGDERNINDMHVLVNDLKELKSRIYVIDFGLTIQQRKFMLDGKINYAYLKKICIGFDPSWKYSSLEYQFMNFLIFQGNEITQSIIDKIINIYVDSHPVMNLLPANFVSDYKKNAKVFYAKYANMDRDDVVRDALSHWKTWDIYHICVKFVSLFMEKDVSNYKFIMMCLLGLHYDPDQRPAPSFFKKILQAIVFRNQEIKINNEEMASASKSIMA